MALKTVALQGASAWADAGATDRIALDSMDPGLSRSPSRLLRRLLVGSVLGLLAAALLWARGAPLFVAWEVARDHDRCLSRTRLPARLWSSEPSEIGEWLESRGTPVQPLPARAGSLTLIGVRYCPLADRIAAHVYYGGEKSYVSVFVLSGPARIHDGWQGEFSDVKVRLLRSAGRILAIVGTSDKDVEAVTRAFRTSVASHQASSPADGSSPGMVLMVLPRG